MTRKRKSQFMRALEERRDEARQERARREHEEAAEETGEADRSEPRPSEAKVLQERAPALWPTKKHRPYWK